MSTAPPIEVPINIPGASCRILVGNKLLENAGEYCRERGLKGRCVIITDDNVTSLHAAALKAALNKADLNPDILSVPAGEKSKSLLVVGDLCDRMIEAGLDRSSFLIALGGGVIGDLAGFVAAIYYRGIPFVQIPTTIVAQVDSATGGKTGVNAPAGKNLIGAFHQPRLVLADTTTLTTLQDREYREGFAEVIKHAAIRDAAMLDSLKPDAPRESLAPLMARNITIKATIVSEDEKESGVRALLNFGHTVGHAIENVAGYGRYLHGEAISLGLAAALEISRRKYGLSNEESDLVLSTLSAYGLPLQLPDDLCTEDLIVSARRDKKFAEGKIRFVVCPTLGSAHIAEDITENDIRIAIESLRS